MSVSVPRHSVVRPHSTIIIVDPDRPHEQHLDCLQCVHCQYTWVVQPGSGKRRGFCLKCNGPTCGHEGCRECRGPIEKRIEMYEAGKIARL